jgi:hypothetical protein
LGPRNENSTPNFRATLSESSLEEFLSKVGPALANLHFQHDRAPYF